ncbi:ankyrin repeat and fibronectin type-III domain-containing protein 1-like isoform X1 [Amblyraja radiata]|uniref:ankyrin repeat and fibronectin type-III domain-containing protein 1-like isoform X1 n=1 Tax=Amblyraja radiata TaxID=386614 RepID=UPI001403BAC5|nr:ankyrin repeat and fibronectin type-III domain-containing protein 1-like isoform X1 [Amblyraja radiata]
MSTFGKLTDYFHLRKSRAELRVSGTDTRRGDSPQPRSLERRPQRAGLVQSGALPSIPQSPTAPTRTQGQPLADQCGNPLPARVKPLPTGDPESPHPDKGGHPLLAGAHERPHPARTQDRAPDLHLDEPWQSREDGGDSIPQEGADPCGRGTGIGEPPSSFSRPRFMHLRKSVSVDDHLSWLESTQDLSESRMEKVKVNLRRKFSLGSADRKESLQKRLESSKLRLVLPLSRKDRVNGAGSAVSVEPLPRSRPRPRPRSLSLDWSSSPRMNQQVRDLQLAHSRRLVSPASPSAAKRLYRNLSGKFKVNYTSFDEPSLMGRNEKNKQRRSGLKLQGSEAVFEAVEQQDLDTVQMLLKLYTPDELDLSTPNSEGLTPLDVAIMTNNVPMAKLLLQAGAKESPHFVSLESRAMHLSRLVRDSEQRLSELAAQVVNQAHSPDCTEKEKQLKAWDWHSRLFKRMKTGFEHAQVPDAPAQVRLSVAGSTSLLVTFQEPLSINSAVVTKYKVEWSTSPDFSTLTGETVLDGMKALSSTMMGLVTGQPYYARVSAHNMKGWGPPCSSVPACVAPSSWRDADSREARRQGRPEALEQLLMQVKTHHQQCLCHENAKVHLPGRKHSMSKSIKHLFQPTSKFVKNLKRGLYLAAVLYKDEDVVVTHEEQIPVVDVDDSYSSSLMQDFLWFMKVSYMWEESRWLGQCMSPSSSSCSSVLQARHKMLVAVAQLQGLLGTEDLGQLYFEPIKDKQGNVLMVTLRELSSYQSLENARWIPLARVQSQRKCLTTADEPTALDMLLSTMHEKLTYHRQSQAVPMPGLYLGYLKLCSSVDQIRVLVSSQLPNILCHVRVRSNQHVCREEWEWLQRLNSLEEPELADPCEGSTEGMFQKELRAAIPELMKLIAVPLQQVKEYRLYSQEVLEFADDLSFLLLLPPSEEVCTAPGQVTPCPRSGLLTMPLQSFELVHFLSYDKPFISLYCQLSALLELDLLLSQQALREAFSDSEVVAAKQRHQQVQDFTQRMEEVWREVRWIMDVLQYARYKQPSGGVPLRWLLDFSGDGGKEEPRSPASPGYLPSPRPSPETRHRHLSPQAGSPAAGDEGWSEVLVSTASARDCRAQSPKELDLIPSSTGTSSQRPGHKLQEGPPDVLGARGQCQGSGHQRPAPQPLYDSDFVLPSRQLELLHITEKRQAYCVRTSGLDIPPQPFHIQRQCCPHPESLHECPAEPSTSAPGVGRRWLDTTHSLGTSPPSGCPAQTPDPSGQMDQPLEKGAREQGLDSVRLNVYPQYQTGLSKEMSVQLCVSDSTCAREIVASVIRKTNEAVRRMSGRTEARLYPEDQVQDFGLVLSMDNCDQWLRDDFVPLTLHHPWTKGRLCVRIRDCSPLLTQQGKATTV